MSESRSLMDVITSRDPRFSTTSHPSFRFVYASIQDRINTELSNPTLNGYDKIHRSDKREDGITRAFRGLIDQGLLNNIPLLDESILFKPIIRNKSNQFDVRRALVLQQCDDISIALMDYITIATPTDVFEICSFVHHLQLARALYLSYPSTDCD